MRTERARSPKGPAPSEGQVISSVRPPRAARSSSPRGQAHGKTHFGFRRFRNAMVAAMVAVAPRPDADLSSAARRWRGARARSREGSQMAGPQTRIHWRALATLLGGVALGVLHVPSRRAASFTVTRTDDTERGACNPGDCSLREAIEAANALAPETITITLPAGTYGLTIAQRLSMSADITITGAGSAATIVDGNQLVGVFDIIGTDEIDGITVRNGLDASGVGGGGIHNGGTFTGTDLALDGNTTSGPGGGIYNTGLISLMNVALDGNRAAADGGALWNAGSLDVVNGTISRSAAGGNGAGFWNDGTTTLTNATLANNSTVAGMGGALWNDGVLLLDSGTVAGNGASGGGGTSNNASGTVEVRNTVLAANTPDNCSGGIISDGNNIDSGSSCTPTVAGDLPNTDPLLGSLEYTPPGPAFLETRAPLAGSPAIDAAAGCPPPSTDERGVARPQGASCDICAVEASPVTATTTPTGAAPRAATAAATTSTTAAATTSTTAAATTSTTAAATTSTTAATTTTLPAPPEDCGNCVDDDGDGRTDYEDPACCAQTAAMQVKKVLIVPGPDVTVQFRNQNGELLCANIAHQRWKHGSRRGPFQFGDPTGTVAQGLRKMEIKVSKSGSARFLTAGKKMDLGRYARPERTATVRVGDRCSTATLAPR